MVSQLCPSGDTYTVVDGFLVLFPLAISPGSLMVGPNGLEYSNHLSVMVTGLLNALSMVFSEFGQNVWSWLGMLVQD